MDWKAHWHPHGKGETKGGVQTGLGLALHTWGGAANVSQVIVPRQSGRYRRDRLPGTQDLGTGTRTASPSILAETFGIPLTVGEGATSARASIRKPAVRAEAPRSAVSAVPIAAPARGPVEDLRPGRQELQGRRRIAYRQRRKDLVRQTRRSAPGNRPAGCGSDAARRRRAKAEERWPHQPGRRRHPNGRRLGRHRDRRRPHEKMRLRAGLRNDHRRCRPPRARSTAA